MKFLNKNIKLIVKIQAWARGNRARKQTAFMKSKQIGSSRYFTFAEFKETVSGSTSNFTREPRQTRPSYTYKTGAVYDGEWKGGFRDG